MIATYCTYGLYDEDACKSLEEGDCVDELSYWEDEHVITLEDVEIEDIQKDKIMVDTGYKEVTIDVDDIVGWN